MSKVGEDAETCKYEENMYAVMCDLYNTSICKTCGWNPESGVKARRIARMMREYHARIITIVSGKQKENGEETC